MAGLPPAPPPGSAMLPAGTFDGVVAFVTGGGTGLGKAIAVEFGRLGAGVAIASRDADHRRAGVEAVEAAGARACEVEVDVRDEAAVVAAFDAVEADLGAVGILVNNAAGNFPVAAERLSPNGWRAVVDIVLNGTFLCSREFAIRRMALGLPGAILNVVASYAWTGGPGASHSAAAKAGVDNMTKTLAVEWAPDGIRVNSIAPGLFPHDDEAPAIRELRRSGRSRDELRSPALRTGAVHELGWAATYLCSPYANFVSGHTFVIDGANWQRRGLLLPEFTPVRDQLDSGR